MSSSFLAERWQLGAGTRPFLLASLLVILTAVAFVALHRQAAVGDMESAWAEEGERLRGVVELAIQDRIQVLSTIAGLYAADVHIVESLLAGRQAIVTGGGRADDLEATAARLSLYQHLGAAWRRAMPDFQVHELQFHLGPEPVTFLRVRTPAHFGDRTTDDRSIVAGTIADGRPRAGIEIDHGQAMLRSASAVSAMDDGTWTIIGAVVVGSSLEALVQSLDTALDARVAIVLDGSPAGTCVVQAASRPDAGAFPSCGAPISPAPSGHPAVRVDGADYASHRLPLPSGAGVVDTAALTGGHVVIWQQVGDRIASFQGHQWVALVNAIGLAVVVVLILFFAFRFVERSRRAAEVADQAKSSFLATMSHEFRTPLNAVIGFTDLLSQGVGGPVTDKQREYLHDIRQAGNNLLGIVNDILHFREIETRQLRLLMERLDLSAALDQLLKTVADEADAAGVKVIATELPTSLPVMADRYALRRVMTKLMTNAINHTPPGGTVSVEAERLEQDVVVTITDTGPGIPPDRLEALAQPFTKVQDIYAAAAGVGLGLAIARGLMETHGGHLVVDSIAGNGTTVRLMFPAAVGEDDAETRTGSPDLLSLAASARGPAFEPAAE